ncbi:UNVERIFIED_CONTAM: hypothetical protein NCL1_11080 [Trichonephila clavipes]
MSSIKRNTHQVFVLYRIFNCADDFVRVLPSLENLLRILSKLLDIYKIASRRGTVIYVNTKGTHLHTELILACTRFRHSRVRVSTTSKTSKVVLKLLKCRTRTNLMIALKHKHLMYGVYSIVVGLIFQSGLFHRLQVNEIFH